MKSTAISLEAVEEMRTQALFELWHCDSLEAVLAGIFGLSRPGTLLAPSTTLEPAWVSDVLQTDVAALRSPCPFLYYAQELLDFSPGPRGPDAAEQSLHSAVSMGTLEDASGTLGVDSFALCPTPERTQTVRSELLRVRDTLVLHLGGSWLGSAASSYTWQGHWLVAWVLP